MKAKLQSSYQSFQPHNQFKSNRQIGAVPIKDLHITSQTQKTKAEIRIWYFRFQSMEVKITSYHKASANTIKLSQNIIWVSKIPTLYFVQIQTDLSKKVMPKKKIVGNPKKRLVML